MMSLYTRCFLYGVATLFWIAKWQQCVDVLMSQCFSHREFGHFHLRARFLKTLHANCAPHRCNCLGQQQTLIAVLHAFLQLVEGTRSLSGITPSTWLFTSRSFSAHIIYWKWRSFRRSTGPPPGTTPNTAERTSTLSRLKLSTTGQLTKWTWKLYALVGLSNMSLTSNTRELGVSIRMLFS